MVNHLRAHGGGAECTGEGTTCLDDLLASDAALETSLKHPRRAGRVDLARRGRDLGYRRLAEASDGEQSLGRGGEDSSDGGDVGVL